MPRFKSIAYLLFLIVPLQMPIAAWLATHTSHPDAAAWFPMFFVFVLLPLTDYALGKDRSNPRDDDHARELERQPWYRWLTLACLPLYLALLYWSCLQWLSLPLSPFGKFGWLFAQGVVGGIVAINVAHELIHKTSRLEQWAGGVLLASVGYAGFKVEHLRGHHVHVSTPQDASSAPFGVPLYRFLPSALKRNFQNAWKLEAERLQRLDLSAWHWRNELLWWYALSGLFLLGFSVTFGWLGALFFVAQSLGAAVSLEIINYVEHYGLQRREISPGRFERTTHLHSWNSSYLLSNLILFQLQRHSDHHENPRRRYQALRHYDDSPQLPGGYSAMYVLALFPPLWRRVIDPRVRAYYSGQDSVESCSDA